MVRECVGAAVVRADWLMLDSMWVAPTSPPAEMVAHMLKRAGKRTWHPDSVVHVMGGGGAAGGARAGDASTAGLKVVGPAVSLIQHVRWLHPVGCLRKNPRVLQKESIKLLPNPSGAHFKIKVY
jgi:hypothetical protein